MLKDNIKFDSKKEAMFYVKYKQLLKAGKITKLVLQPSFTLQEKFIDHLGENHRAIKYVADFSFIENGKLVVVDVKGFKTDIYKLKKKLLLFKYDGEFEFREV